MSDRPKVIFAVVLPAHCQLRELRIAGQIVPGVMLEVSRDPQRLEIRHVTGPSDLTDLTLDISARWVEP